MPFSVPSAIKRADEILAGPCAGHLPRVAGRGERIARFVLPLELLPTTNRTRGAQPWVLGALKEKVFKLMWLQHPSIRATPLPGRPQIRAVRFSTSEPDALADWPKIAIDCLAVPRPPKKLGGRSKKGLGLIRDDAPRFVDIAQPWWERARQREGLALIEVWSGTP
jgi:hypothetical protein